MPPSSELVPVNGPLQGPLPTECLGPVWPVFALRSVARGSPYVCWSAGLLSFALPEERDLVSKINQSPTSLDLLLVASWHLNMAFMTTHWIKCSAADSPWRPPSKKGPVSCAASRQSHLDIKKVVSIEAIEAFEIFTISAAAPTLGNYSRPCVVMQPRRIKWQWSSSTSKTPQNMDSQTDQHGVKRQFCLKTDPLWLFLLVIP